MNKKIFLMSLALFFLFSLIYTWAQNNDVFNHPLTPQTTSTFNLICTRLADKPIVKGIFTQEKLLSRFGRSLVSSGNFLIAAEHGMVWETLKPVPSTMVMGKDFMLQSRPDGQMSVMNAQGNETFVQMANVLSSVFSGNSSGLLENFEVFFYGDIPNWNIGLLPKNSMIASFAEKITMSGGITPGGFVVIRTIRIFEKNGDVITYTLSNHNYPAELNANEKAFFTIP